MKTTSTTNIKNLLTAFDAQLLNLLKEDLRQQNQKVKTRLINMATRSYDHELLGIIKDDIANLRNARSRQENKLAQAG